MKGSSARDCWEQPTRAEMYSLSSTRTANVPKVRRGSGAAGVQSDALCQAVRNVFDCCLRNVFMIQPRKATSKPTD